MATRKLAFALIGVGLIAGAAGLYVSYRGGAEAKRAMESSLSALSENSRFDARLVRYDRGWFQSSARSVLSIEPANKKPIEIYFDHEIDHRPGMGHVAKVVTRMELAGELREEVRPYFGDRSPLTSVTTIGYSGGYTTQFSSPTVDASPANAPDTRVIWSGLEGRSEADAKLEEMSMTAQAPSLVVRSPQADVEMKGFDLESQMILDEGVWLGESTLRLEGLDVLSKQVPTPEGEPFSAKGLYLDTRASRNGELVNYSITYGAKEVVAAQRLHQPTLQLELRRLDFDTVKHLTRKLRELNEQGLAPEQAGAKVTQLFMANLPGLLEHQPEIAITDLSVGTPNGPVDGSIELRYIGDPQMINAFVLLHHLQGEADLEIGKKVLEELAYLIVSQRMAGQNREGHMDQQQMAQMARAMVSAQVKGLLDKGFLKETGKTYTTRLTLDAGELAVNGQPLPLPRLGELQ